MVEDAGGSNDGSDDGTSGGDFTCLNAYVNELDRDAERAMAPLQDQYDSIASIVSSIGQEVAGSQRMEQAARNAVTNCEDLLESASQDIYNVAYLQSLVDDVDAEIAAAANAAADAKRHYDSVVFYQTNELQDAVDAMDRSDSPTSDSNDELIENLKAELDVLIRKYSAIMEVYDDVDDTTDVPLAAARNAVTVA